MTSISERVVDSRKSGEAIWLPSTLAAGALFTVLAVLGVYLRPLLPVDETRYLSVAWEMWRDHSLLVPHLNGAVYSQKPPLLFWLVDLLWSITGVSGFGARLIAPFFGLLSIFLTALLARRLWPDEPQAAARAAWILATTGLFLVFGSLTMFDSLLMAATLLAIIGLIEQSRNGGLLGWPLVAVAVALGVLAKGPAIVVHVVPLALLPFLWNPGRSKQALIKWYRGFFLAMLAAGGLVAFWFLPAVLTQGESYLEAVVWNQGAGRVVSSFAHHKPFWFFIALVPLFLWPWGWSGRALKAIGPGNLWRDQGGRICAIWIAAAFVIHSVFSGKQLHYLLPELPALALVFARLDWSCAGLEGAKGWRILPLAPLLLAVPVAWAAHFGMIPQLEQLFAPLPLWLLLSGSLGSLLLAYLLLILPHAGQVAALSSVGTLVIFYLIGTPLLQANYSGARIGEALAEHESLGIAQYGAKYSGEFTFLGRLTQHLEELNTPDDLRDWVKSHPGGAVIAKYEVDTLPWRPEIEVPYRGKSYLIWQVPAGAGNQ
ncbi:MAG: glycosyltransferase family 39 protein [Limibacillus sp.]